ncbi:hypothetical protein BRC97_00855 [Halobacteriales archaeon QS_6_71_20]|nr:MAG: hypothetical protein BRC97_00855 [Halobacteriales archaeon QS_6_71_20]
MVPNLPSPSRRALLAGTGIALAGATAGVGATAPTALPDPVTDQASKWLPGPTDHRWRPPVSEAHAREAVDRLADEVDRGRELWAELDADEGFTGDGGHLESAREDLDNGDYREALFSATYGLEFAAEDVGFALARLDRPEADPERLAERGGALRERADRVLDGIDGYPVVDAGRDLGWYHEIERRIRFARLDAHRRDPDREREYDDRDIGSIHAGNVEAEQRVRDAEYYRDLLRDRVGDDGDPLADRLDRLDRQFRERVDGFPERDAVREEVQALSEDEPYRHARRYLWTWCYDADYRLVGDDLTLLRATTAAQALAQRRAHEAAVDALVVEPGDDGFDSGHVVREKRAAMRRYRRVVGDSPAPLLSILTERVAEDIDVAEVRRRGGRNGPAWLERVDAYCYALVARTKLKEYPRIYERFAARE